MPFGRSAKPNNRSQHSLAVESAGSISEGALAGAGPGSVVEAQPQPQLQLQPQIGGPGPGQHHQLAQLQQGPSHSSSTSASALSQNESFVQDLRTFNVSQNQQPPPPHPHHLYAAVSASGDPQSHQQQQQQLHSINTNAAVTDAKARKAAFDFVDAVARSQSQRYHQVATPIQPNPSHGASYEDLPKTLQPAHPQHSPAFAYHQLQLQQQQQPAPPLPQQQQPPPPLPQQPQGTPVEPRRSTRRLIKNILAGAPKNDQQQQQSRNPLSHQYSQSQSQSQSYNFYDTVALPGRRSSSKRISNPNPPALQTGPSQVSLDQQSLDWQSQGTQTQPSPLQNHPQDFQQQRPTLRRVPTNSEHSPYSDVDENGHHPQAQIHVQTQQLASDTHHHRQLGQVVLDPHTLQYQFISHSPHQQSPQSQTQPDGSSPSYASSGHLGPEQHRNPETISQVSHESPVTEGDQYNPSNNPSTTVSPAARYSNQVQDFPSRTSSLQPHQQQGNSSPEEAQSPRPPHQQQPQQNMGPPSVGTPQTRRSQTNDKNTQGGMPSGPPPGYRHSQQSSNSMNALPPVSQGASQNNFRQSTIQERQPGQFEDQGRNSPQPAEEPEKAFKDLLTKYKNVKRLYFDGKTQIEQLNGQVEQLQNAVANQRISQSRTALDDNEYTTRFNRLNGAINNLSFNIRKDWQTLPSWLDKYVSVDALKTGKQEMTAVGRAVITRWIVEEIFDSCFHPGLEPGLSKQLKDIEHNIRRFSYTLSSQEEYDALTSKVVSWRMTTLEGLQHVLQSAESANHRQDFTRKATTNLTASLFRHLADPPPAGVDGSASTIVELAVGIAANLPLESRDVAIKYPLPQENINHDIMDVEKTPLPPIDTRPPDSDGDAESREDSGKDTGADKNSSKERNKSRTGMSATSALSSLLSSAPAALVPGAGNSRKGSVASTTGRKSSFAATDSTTNLALPPKDSSKVRFAGFLAVEVRGRQVLVKAPVWTLA